MWVTTVPQQQAQADFFFFLQAVVIISKQSPGAFGKEWKKGLSRAKLQGCHVAMATLWPASKVAQGRASGRCCFLPLVGRSSEAPE